MRGRKRQIKQATLVIRCTVGEAELIRQAAKAEHRSVSQYLLNAVADHIVAGSGAEEQIENPLNRPTGTCD